MFSDGFNHKIPRQSSYSIYIYILSMFTTFFLLSIIFFLLYYYLLMIHGSVIIRENLSVISLKLAYAVTELYSSLPLSGHESVYVRGQRTTQTSSFPSGNLLTNCLYIYNMPIGKTILGKNICMIFHN